MVCAFQFPAQFTDADAGAQVDLSHPDLEITVIALAGIGGERRSLVADLRGLIDAGAFGQRGASLLVADQGVHEAPGDWAVDVLTEEHEWLRALQPSAAVIASAGLVTGGTGRCSKSGACLCDLRD